MRSTLLFTASLLTGFCALAQTGATAPIESYIAPTAQFPAESNYAARTPAPLGAYDSVRGTLIGHIRLENPKCLTMPEKSKEKAGCEFPLNFVYKPMGSPTTHKVELAEWSYETMGMPSYKASVQDGAYAWSQVQHAAGAVWVKTSPDAVHLYENVAYLVPDLVQLCKEPGGQCTAVTPAIQKEIERVTAVVETCFDSPYSVVDRITKDGKRYYKLGIENLSEGTPTTLPKTIYVPTRRPDGSHTGEFFSRGC